MKTKKGTYDKILPLIPDEVRIGGALDWEVYNTTHRALQDSSVSSSVSGSEPVELDMVS